ncbi:MAG: MFS transporter [Bacteroidia bacterium]|nr:MFS transporter [Bacteroidia bacterium]
MKKNLSAYVKEPQFLSIGIIFALNAVLFSLWVTRLPEVKETLGLSEGTLGFVLFFMPLGAFLAMLVTSSIVRKWGAGPVTIWSTAAYCFSMLFPLLAPNSYALSASLFMIGITSGVMDISMNAVAAALEKIHDKVIMATTHGFFSLGGMIGAFLGSAFIGIGFPGWAPMSVAVLLCWIGLILLNRMIGHIIDKDEADEGSHFALPGKAVLGLAIIAFCTMMGEGAVADWSGVYLKGITLAEGTLIGLGYAGFSLAMTIGRFYGDGLIHRMGGLRIILLGSLLSLSGLGLVLVGETYSTILGFTMIGFGYSSIIPVVFSEAARSDKQSASRGITAVASLGYLGFLVGPVVIGLISEEGGLRMGMIFLLTMALTTLLIARGSIRKG